VALFNTALSGEQIAGLYEGRLVGVEPGVPEPASWALMLTGFFGFGAARRRRRQLAARAA
jgi:hypothetical protein